MALKLGIRHWVLEYNQDYLNDDIGLTLAIYGKVKFVIR